LADGSHAQLLASMRRVWEEAALSLPRIDEQAAWLSFQARRDAAVPTLGGGRALAPRFRAPAARRSSWLAPALAAGLLAMVAVGGFGWWKHKEELRLASTAPPREYLAT